MNKRNHIIDDKASEFAINWITDGLPEALIEYVGGELLNLANEMLGDELPNSIVGLRFFEIIDKGIDDLSIAQAEEWELGQEFDYSMDADDIACQRYHASREA